MTFRDPSGFCISGIGVDTAACVAAGFVLETVLGGFAGNVISKIFDGLFGSNKPKPNWCAIGGPGGCWGSGSTGAAIFQLDDQELPSSKDEESSENVNGVNYDDWLEGVVFRPEVGVNTTPEESDAACRDLCDSDYEDELYEIEDRRRMKLDLCEVSYDAGDVQGAWSLAMCDARAVDDSGKENADAADERRACQGACTRQYRENVIRLLRDQGIWYPEDLDKRRED